MSSYCKMVCIAAVFFVVVFSGCVAKVEPIPPDFKPLLPLMCTQELYESYTVVYKKGKTLSSSSGNTEEAWKIVEAQVTGQYDETFSTKDLPASQKKLMDLYINRLMTLYKYTYLNAYRMNMMSFEAFQQNACSTSN